MKTKKFFILTAVLILAFSIKIFASSQNVENDAYYHVHSELCNYDDEVVLSFEYDPNMENHQILQEFRQMSYKSSEIYCGGNCDLFGIYYCDPIMEPREILNEFKNLLEGNSSEWLIKVDENERENILCITGHSWEWRDSYTDTIHIIRNNVHSGCYYETVSLWVCTRSSSHVETRRTQTPIPSGNCK